MKNIFSMDSIKVINIFKQNIWIKERVIGNYMNNAIARLLSFQLNINQLFRR